MCEDGWVHDGRATTYVGGHVLVVQLGTSVRLQVGVVQLHVNLSACQAQVRARAVEVLSDLVVAEVQSTIVAPLGVRT